MINGARLIERKPEIDNDDAHESERLLLSLFPGCLALSLSLSTSRTLSCIPMCAHKRLALSRTHETFHNTLFQSLPRALVTESKHL